MRLYEGVVDYLRGYFLGSVTFTSQTNLLRVETGVTVTWIGAPCKNSLSFARLSSLTGSVFTQEQDFFVNMQLAMSSASASVNPNETILSSISTSRGASFERSSSIAVNHEPRG